MMNYYKASLSTKDEPINYKLPILLTIGLLTSLYFITPPVWKFKQGKVAVQHHKDKIVSKDSPNWQPLNKISLYLISSIISAEDARFWQHHGLDFYEIIESIKTNFAQAKFVRGASTITQQLVKLTFLSREKSVFRKVREAVGAIILECILSKEEILTWYLNIVTFGPGIYGVKAAAKKYFQSDPAALNLEQSIQLSIILPAPNLWSKDLVKKYLGQQGQKRFLNILTKMLAARLITKAQWQHTASKGNFGEPINLQSKKI